MLKSTDLTRFEYEEPDNHWSLTFIGACPWVSSDLSEHTRSFLQSMSPPSVAFVEKTAAKKMALEVSFGKETARNHRSQRSSALFPTFMNANTSSTQVVTTPPSTLLFLCYLVLFGKPWFAWYIMFPDMTTKLRIKSLMTA